MARAERLVRGTGRIFRVLRLRPLHVDRQWGTPASARRQRLEELPGCTGRAAHARSWFHGRGVRLERTQGRDAEPRLLAPTLRERPEGRGPFHHFERRPDG